MDKIADRNRRRKGLAILRKKGREIEALGLKKKKGISKMIIKEGKRKATRRERERAVVSSEEIPFGSGRKFQTTSLTPSSLFFFFLFLFIEFCSVNWYYIFIF